MTSHASDRAIDCFTHGVAHLISELGTDRGLRKGMDVLENLAAADLSGLVGDLSRPPRRGQHHREPSRLPGEAKG